MQIRVPQLALSCVALSLLAAAPQARAAGDWQWSATPYIWATGLTVDSDFDAPPVDDGSGNSDTRFNDLIDKLDGVFQGHFEGRSDHWGGFIDYTFIGFADEKERTFVRTESDLDARLLEMAVFWSPGGERDHGLDIFGGLRRIDVDATVDFTPVNPAFPSTSYKDNRGFNDFLIGARYTWELSEKWNLTLRGDGSFGDTDGTWGASGLFTRETGNGAWVFGYRYLTADFSNDFTDYSITLHGPEIGYAFVW
jgi:hypothetical protein